MPPAARMWFSLIRRPSSRPARWLLAPPTRTAYFSSTRRPGVVLRVSMTFACVPLTRSHAWRLAVATPDRRLLREHRRRRGVRRNRRFGGQVAAPDVFGQRQTDDGVYVGAGRKDRGAER